MRKVNLEYERSRIELLRAMGASSFEDDDLSFEIAEEINYQPVSLDTPSLREAAMRLPQMQAAQARVERANLCCGSNRRASGRTSPPASVTNATGLITRSSPR